MSFGWACLYLRADTGQPQESTWGSDYIGGHCAAGSGYPGLYTMTSISNILSLSSLAPRQNELTEVLS